ncbi:hypothetical protein BGHDH14_bgh04435 [Blumeria hordei DH14]|uniref:DUF8035 domain-containing protein n=1 Tax=Blumeria graminis f. sp. hordei (strain DH14) TaxID=546991 RepID=N1JFI8_BLUG1|nr:hypothetical protein BGHDH14_bgh04435 [Blumeria hordei DH14]
MLSNLSPRSPSPPRSPSYTGPNISDRRSFDRRRSQSRRGSLKNESYFQEPRSATNSWNQNLTTNIHHSNNRENERYALDEEYNRSHIRPESETVPSQPLPQSLVYGRSPEDRCDGQVSTSRLDDEDYYQKHSSHRRELPPLQRERLVHRDHGRARYCSPSPPRREASTRPAILRRQSSLDIFDRKPHARNGGKVIYDIQSKYSDPISPGLALVPLQEIRHAPISHRHERTSPNDHEVTESRYYEGRNYHDYPQRIGEVELASRPRRESRGHRRSHSVRGLERSNSTSSYESSSTESSFRSKYPKRGKTRMPAKLVNKRAIIDLGYPFEEDVSLNEPQQEFTKVYSIAAPSAQYNLRENDISTIRTQPVSHTTENVKFTTHLLSSPTAGAGSENTLTIMPSRPKDERSIAAEIKALEAERDALRSLRKAEQFRREGHGEAVSPEVRERDERRQEKIREGKHHEGKHREGKHRESKNRDGKHREGKHRSRSKETSLRKDRKGKVRLTKKENHHQTLIDHQEFNLNLRGILYEHHHGKRIRSRVIIRYSKGTVSVLNRPIPRLLIICGFTRNMKSNLKVCTVVTVGSRVFKLYKKFSRRKYHILKQFDSISLKDCRC